MSEGWGGTAEFLDRHHADLSPLGQALALSARDDAKAEAAERQEEAARQEAAGERLEALTLANRMGGDPLGKLELARAQFEAADDVCRDLADKLEKATAKRSRAHESIRFLSRQLDEVTAAVSRPAVAVNPFEAARQRAHHAFAEVTRARLAAAAVSPQRERRPFASCGAVMDDAQREGWAAMTGHEIVRVCGPGRDGRLTNSAPGLAVR